MRNLLLILLLAVPIFSAAAHARAIRYVPVTFTLRDDYEHFIGPAVVSKRFGQFDVSLGESHEGDPGFGGLEPGSEFEYAVVIYHMEPSRQPLPYVPTYVPVAKGKYRHSVTPLIRGPKTVRFKGVNFTITIKRLSFVYGGGRTQIEVTASDS